MDYRKTGLEVLEAVGGKDNVAMLTHCATRLRFEFRDKGKVDRDRVEVDGRNEKIGKKIREATLEKIPYMLVVGDRDMENQTVSVRLRTGEDLGAMSVADFAARLKQDVDTKAIW